MSVALQDLRNTVSPRARTHTLQHARSRLRDYSSPRAAAGPACLYDAEQLSIMMVDLCASVWPEIFADVTDQPDQCCDQIRPEEEEDEDGSAGSGRF